MNYLQELEYLLRIILSALCGLAIGLERRGRMKSAGPRTHLLVALSAALMMIISKYGFFDVVGINGISVDASRVASNIITGITFMGAGLIFVHKREVLGVTTAAGLWATVGIGMAVGSGMYVLGISSCVLVVLLQLLLHSPLRIFREPWVASVSVVLDSNKSSFTEFCEYLQKNNVELLGPHVKRCEGDTIEIKFDGRFAPIFTHESAAALLESFNGVNQVKF